MRQCFPVVAEKGEAIPQSLRGERKGLGRVASRISREQSIVEARNRGVPVFILPSRNRCLCEMAAQGVICRRPAGYRDSPMWIRPLRRSRS
jgi:hypothetical protein